MRSAKLPLPYFSLLLAVGCTLFLGACAGMGGAQASGKSTALGSGADGAECKTPATPLHIAPADSGAMSLEEAVVQLSKAVLNAPAGAAWKPQAAHAEEIRRFRPQLSELVEDANWIITLSGELNGPRPAGQKAGLRRLQESYAADAPHAEITSQVNALLADIQDEQLRRELKKLANRSWERERRGPVKPSQVDTTITPDQYCAERRVQAARAFADARAATDTDQKQRSLLTSLGLLDDCLKIYPDAAEAEKARQNRARVQQELAP